MIRELLLMTIIVAVSLLILLLFHMHKKKLNKRLVFEKINREKNVGSVKSIVILVIIIVLLSIVLFCGYYILNQQYSGLLDEKASLEGDLKNIQNELNNSNSFSTKLGLDLSQYKEYLLENVSELESLKSGDKYNLHDPTWNETVEFFDNNIEINETIELINLSKNNGIRCAYVIIEMEIGNFELIGFNTVDYDMMYVEPHSHYLVYPEIGSNYFDCVDDQPYGSSTPEVKDEITNILVIW